MSALITEYGTPIEASQILLTEEATKIKPVWTRRPGRIKIRLRQLHFVQAFVKTENGITQHDVADVGDHWELMPAKRENRRSYPVIHPTSGPLMDELRYIAESPPPENGGFHPRLVETAKKALDEITTLRQHLETTDSELRRLYAKRDDEAPTENTFESNAFTGGGGFEIKDVLIGGKSIPQSEWPNFFQISPPSKRNLTWLPGTGQGDDVVVSRSTWDALQLALKTYQEQQASARRDLSAERSTQLEIFQKQLRKIERLQAELAKAKEGK